MSLHRFYPLARPFLFTLDPEAAHELTLKSLDRAAAVGIAGLLAPNLPVEAIKVMGLSFPNRVGLAAGLDKNAQHLAGLATFGFGFIEAGTVTPRPQPGNPKPRMFRLPQAEALINRLGFNNGGVAAFVRNVERSSYRGVLGINIGKNFDTPNENAVDDYLTCLRAVYAKASYITVNVSSPNTKGLRDLQGDVELRALLSRLLDERSQLTQQHGRKVPLVVKIAPDLEDAAVRNVARVCMAIGLDGIVATNTTIARDAVAGQPHATEPGGLSGRPVQKRSTEVIRVLAAELRGALPIIGAGGIMSADDAREKIAAGASLVQIYTGLIYHGPQLIADCVKALQRP